MIFPKETSCPAPSSRSERRRRKSAPLAFRLSRYLGAWAHRKEGAWKPCPSYADLARHLDVSLDSISRAFWTLEADPACRLAFVSGFTGPGGTRQKMFALKSWLKFDGQPLHYREDGRPRGIRPSFRRGVDRLSGGAESAAEPENPDISGEGNSDFCHPRDKEERLPSADKAPPRGELSKTPRGKSLLAQAWKAARTAKRDGELFWDNSKVLMPLPTLKTLLLEPIRRGLDWRPALVFAVHQAHDAACLSGEIRSPGAFAAVIFRQRLGLPGGGRRRPGRSQSPTATAPQKTEDAPGPLPLVKAPSPPPAAPPVDRAAVREQAGLLAAMMRAALSAVRQPQFPGPDET